LIGAKYCGDEAQSKRGILTLKYPIEHGVVTNFDDWSKLVSHSFYNELRVSPEEHPVLLIEKPGTPSSIRERMCQVLFEEFNVPTLYLASSVEMSLFSYGLSTGVVLEIGDASIRSAAVYNGKTILLN